MQKTMLLDTQQWDLVLDSAGNWAIADDPYSIAQGVASAIRNFLGECWYDTTLGVPYWENILGKLPPLSLVSELIQQETLKVPNVITAACYFNQLENRELQGIIIVTDSLGQQLTVQI